METTKLYSVGRALVGVLFLASGINKIIGFSATWPGGWAAWACRRPGCCWRARSCSKSAGAWRS
jgi:hypothetical protein